MASLLAEKSKAGKYTHTSHKKQMFLSGRGMAKLENFLDMNSPIN
jgi:hypothetical protein